MEAAIRSSVQVGGPPPGQRASDTGPSSQQSQQAPPPQISYQQRIPSGASPIHRPVDTPQSYSKGGVGQPPPQPQPTSRSAASPLSPPRPGPGAANTYPRFADVTAVREAPHRYVQQSAYGAGQVQQFRENPYARIPQVPAQVQDYHRAAGAPTVLSSGSSLPVVSVGPANTMDSLATQGPPTGRQRISLIPPPQHPSEYMSAARPPTQAPPDPGGQPFKKLRLGDANHLPPQQQPLKVDTREHRPATTEAYHPQVEAISPTLPNDTIEERRITKDDLLMQIHKVDVEIGNAENTMLMLKKKEEQLEEASSRPSKVEELAEVQPKHRSLAQKIYAENRKRAAEQHSVLDKMGPSIDLPLYNQPSDVEICQEIIQRHQSFKSRLLLHLRKIKQERAARNAALVDKYAQLSQEWLKRVEKAESSAKRKAKEAKNREFFEKVFTELRKQREDKERFNRVGSRIKSEADLEEIMDGLQEQAMEDKKMRSYAVIPPLMLDARQRRYVYHNENGALPDMIQDFKERQNLNVWTAGEKEIFKEKFLQHPKNFGAIAASLDRKSAQDCVRYYYLSKKTENYKQLLRKSRQRTRSSRNPQKSQQAQTQCIVDSLTTGVTTRLQREQQQKTGGRDRAGAQSTAATSSTTLTTTTTTAASTAASSSSSSSSSAVTATTSVTKTISTQTTSTQTAAGAAAAAAAAAAGGASFPQGGTSGPAPGTAPNASSSSSSSCVTSASVSSTTSNSATSTTSAVPGTCSTATTQATTTVTSTTVVNSTAGSERNSPQAVNGVGNGIAPMDTTAPGTHQSNSTVAQSSGIEGSSIVSGVCSLSVAVHNSEPLLSEDASMVNNKEHSSPSTAPTSVNSSSGSVNATAGNSSATNSISVGEPTRNSSPHIAGTTTAPTTVAATYTSTPNGIKTELVIASAVANDNKSLDKDGKDSLSSGDDKHHSLNSIGGLKGKASAISNTQEIIVDGSDSSDVSDIKKKRLDSDAASNPAILANDLADSSVVENKEKLHPCFVCKAEACPRTRPLKKGRGQQYGIADDIIPSGARVCNSCQCKSVRNRYPNCPLPTCPNPKDRAKRLHNIPPRLFDLAPEMRDPILQEFQIPSNATRCCSACLMRIRRKLDPHNANIQDEDRRPNLTDGDESDLSTSSCDERDAASSDTASAESPNNPNKVKDDIQPPDSVNVAQVNRKTFEDDRLLPPLGQAPRKQKLQEEYDSSATETADEENENSPANRQSPKVILHPNQVGGAMVPPPPSVMQNGPQRVDPTGTGQSLNVREIVFNFIERSLKAGPPPKPGPVPLIKTSQGQVDSRDVTFIREFRNDIPTKQPATTSSNNQPNLQQAPQSRQMQSQPQVSSQADNLATLSVVNSHSHAPQQLINHPHGISATITPVKPQPTSQSQSSSVQQLEMQQKDEMMYSVRNEPEPQTLDLSIKKPSRDAPVHVPTPPVKVQHSTSSISMYRSDQGGQVAPPAQNPAYMSYHHPADLNRPSKSPSVYVSQVPVPISISQQQVGSGRSQQPSPQVSIAQHQAASMQPKTKVSQKLSPKIHQQSPSPSQMMSSGPKGSITHGTPVNSQQQQILVQSSNTLSPRFDGILRQTPPSSGEGNKLGSITQGTPIHLPSHHLQDKQRVYDYYKNNRQSPAQQPQQSQQPQPSQQPTQSAQQSSPQAQNYGSPYARSAYALEQTPQLLSRQIVMHDYMTSQQMHGQQSRVGRSDKESPSPRSSALAGSPASIYYAEKDRSRADYLSRTSPAEHVNSTPSPHRTPPPQRQGVIQRHNTGGSKPPSPSPNRLHIMPHHYPPPGHEAFTSFVDVAVQQPQLPVPQKDEKRSSVSIGDHPSASPAHHDIRYHQMAREQMVMQIHQQQQQQHYRQHAAAAAAVDLQRRQEQYNRERIHAQQERDRERQERERVERHNQERLQAERIERERERERQRERAEEQEREERRNRETARILASSAGQQSFLRGEAPQPVSRGMTDRDRDPYRRSHPGRPTESTFSASKLIDAIIKHSINQGASEPPPANLNREGSSRQFYSARGEPPHPATIAVSENNGKANSPNVINIEDMREQVRGQQQQQPQIKSITLGELTDSIIAKDYGPNPMHSLRAQYMAYLPDSIVVADQWKYNRRIQQQKEAEAAAAAAERSKGPSSAGRSTTPDERQIIRMAQPPSPRHKFPELVMPPDSHYYQAHQAAAAAAAAGHPTGGPSLDRRVPGGAGGSGPSHQFALDCYVKNRIVEAMRTEDERRPDDSHLHGHHDRGDSHRQSGPHGKDMDGTGGGKSTPSYDDGRRSGGGSNSSVSVNSQGNEPHGPQSQYPPPSQQPPPVTTFATTTYPYPYNALNVTGPPPTSGLVPPQTKAMDGGPPPPPQPSLAAEPKPLLSAQYEALSDEE